MKSSLVFIIGLLSFLSVQSQPLRTLYYRNGNKALEGRWTYKPSSYFPSNIVQQFGDPEWNGGNPRYEIRTEVWDRMEVFLSISPEGLVTRWNPDGIKVRE